MGYEKQAVRFMIQGQNLTLRPAAEPDRRTVYEWLCFSDLTPSVLGPPHYPDRPPFTWEEFSENYRSHYFDGTDPAAGRCYVIEVNGEGVGAVAHGRIDPARKETELDIWMRSLAHCGAGRGPEAIRILCEHMHRAHGVRSFILRPSARNGRAVAAFRKAGFEPLMIEREEEIRCFGPGRYADTVVFQKRI